MIQRILLLALVLLAFTMPTEAITLQELQTSPQFKLVHVQAIILRWSAMVYISI